MATLPLCREENKQKRDTYLANLFYLEHRTSIKDPQIMANKPKYLMLITLEINAQVRLKHSITKGLKLSLPNF